MTDTDRKRERLTDRLTVREWSVITDDIMLQRKNICA